MLFVFVQQVVEDFPVKESDAFEVITRSWFEGYDLIDKPVRLMTQVCDVLLPLDLLFDVS
jgi:hypothetical protein